MTKKHHELTAAEREVLERMTDERRVNTQLLSEVTSLDRETVETVLADLSSAGLIQEVTTDLYEISKTTKLEEDRVVQKGIPDPNPDTQTAPIDPTDIEDRDDN
jgi:hypothetical protein